MLLKNFHCTLDCTFNKPAEKLSKKKPKIFARFEIILKQYFFQKDFFPQSVDLDYIKVSVEG